MRRRFGCATRGWSRCSIGGGGGGQNPPPAPAPSLLDDLRRLVEPATRGDPERPLLWTAKSLRNLTAGLCALGPRVSHNTVGTLLRPLGYSLQANRKTRE